MRQVHAGPFVLLLLSMVGCSSSGTSSDNGSTSSSGGAASSSSSGSSASSAVGSSASRTPSSTGSGSSSPGSSNASTAGTSGASSQPSGSSAGSSGSSSSGGVVDTLCQGVAANAGLFTTGLGTTGAPFKLCSVTHLLELRDHINGMDNAMHAGATYALGVDLDLAAQAPWVTIGCHYGLDGCPPNPLRAFHGTLDGRNHVISNLTATVNDTGAHALFNKVSAVSPAVVTFKNLRFTGATVENTSTNLGVPHAVLFAEGENVRVENVDITGRIQAADFVGAVAGYWSGGTLLNVRVNAVVGGGNNDHGLLVGYATNVDMSDVVVQGSVGGYIRLGGVAGRVQGGLLDLIRVDGVTITATGGTAGGVAGQLQGTAVRGAAVDATVQGGSVVGGVVGHVNVTGELQRVRFTGSVTGTNRVGGLVGWLAHAQTLANVVWDVTAAGTVTGMVGVGGLVGEGSPSGLARAYAAVDVTGVDRVGGLLGAGDQGAMRDSFFAGTVQGNAGLPNVGLILGEQTPGPGVMMQNLHVTQESTATNAGGAVNTLGTPQSSPLASFQGAGAAPVSTLLYVVWDFLLVWRVTPGGLPLLAGPP